MTVPAVPAGLLTALQELATISGCQLLGAPCWFKKPRVWAVPIELFGYGDGEHVPSRTRWWLTVDPDHPYGEIKLFPAEFGGLAVTFPHQRHNRRGHRDLPWRAGDLCLEVPDADPDRPKAPKDPDRRLRWTIERALLWLARAAGRELLAQNDPFELPDYAPERSPRFGTVLVCEGDDALERWSAVPSAWGIVEFTTMRCGRQTCTLARRFLLPDGRVAWEPPWSASFRARAGTSHRGAWLWITAPAVLRPWQAPRTWAELRRAARVSIDSPLEEICARLRGQRDALLLLGHGLPERVGGPMRQVAWQALRLPPLPVRAKLPVRLRDVPLPKIDRANGFADAAPIAWLKTENWARERLATRGSLASPWRTRRITVLGAGTLGSHIAEFLVRAGAGCLAVFDDDTAEIGNLVRHVLTLHDLGEAKAVALAARLQAISPFAEVRYDEALAEDPTRADHQLENADLVIDTTGSDQVLTTLSLLPGARPRRWVTVSLGRGADRLYCYHAAGARFPVIEFHGAVRPWLADDLGRHPKEFPWEHAGCWSPVFPAREDDVALFAAAAVREVERASGPEIPLPPLRVFERRLDSDGTLLGIARSDGPPSSCTVKPQPETDAKMNEICDFTPRASGDT